MSPLLTLTTDFGTRDAYVAAMKAVVLSRIPHARLVDVSHDVPPQDLLAAGFVLRETAWLFPEGTTHLVVVDPGVGTERHAVALRARGHTFVGPDNGVFSLLLDGDVPDEIVSLNRPSAWRTSKPSATFHGRDIFAPVAARLAAGAALTDVGTPLDALHPLHWPLPLADDQGVQGFVLYVDHFGNAVTNIPRRLVDEHQRNRALKCYAGGAVLTGVRRTYGEVDEGEPLALYSSSDFLEIAVNSGNAHRLLGIRQGDTVSLVFGD